MSNVSSSNSQGVRVPKLRFPGFEGEWESQKLSDFAVRVMRKNSNNETELPLTISSKDGLVDQITYFNKTVASKDMSGYYLLKNGEFAYNKSYSVGYDFGSVKRLDRYPMGALSTLYICFSLTKHNSDFIKVYFDSLKWYKEIYMIAAEGARNHGLLNVPTEDFFETKHTLPKDIKEQQKIAQFMLLIEKRIEKQRQLVEALKSYKRGVSNRIFRDMYDSSWRTICLGDICSITMGQSPDSSSYNTDGIGVPLVQGNADITNGITTPLRYTSNPTKVCESGSIILSVRAPVGTVSRANQRVCLGRGVCAITSSNTDFIYQLLLCYQDSWKRIEQGGTFTAISGDDIGSFSVSVPDCELQNRIAVFLSQFDTKIRNEDIILQSLQKQKSALLQQLFI